MFLLLHLPFFPSKGQRELFLCFAQVSAPQSTVVPLFKHEPTHLGFANLCYSRWVGHHHPNQTAEFQRVPLSPSFSPAEFQPLFKDEPILPLPYVSPVSDPPHPRGPHLKILLSSSPILLFLQEKSLNVLLRSGDR